MERDAVFFDMDGVVVDSEAYWGNETEPIFSTIEESIPSEEITGLNVEDMYEYLDREYTVSIGRSEFLSLYDDAAEQVYAAADLLPRFDEIIASIDVPIGLVTSSPIHWIDMVFDRFDLHDMFDVVASAEEVEHGKPAPDVYLRAASELSVEPEDCLAIEDSTNGIRAASRAYMTVIAYGDPTGEAISTADEVAKNSDELLSALV